MSPALPKLYYYYYELLPYGKLNAKARHESRRGLLLQSGEGGFACLQPWPELGDHTLREELQGLRHGSPLALGRRALDCMRHDAIARNNGKSLFAPEVPIPQSHATLRLPLEDDDLLQLDKRGFTTGKYKASRNMAQVIADITRCAALLPHWKWRIDFNGILNPHEFPDTARLLQSVSDNKIDFFEDPTPFDEELWLQWNNQGIPVAADWLPNDYTPSEPLPIVVWKPASAPPLRVPAKSWVVTSYMDHPLGQAWAAYEASCLALTGEHISACGLSTQELYHPNAFSECLGPATPSFFPPAGTGLGFDDLLYSLPWKKLK